MQNTTNLFYMKAIPKVNLRREADRYISTIYE